jgi:hypothetical protein
MAAGAGFVSNLVLWSEAGYFHNLSETKPLLHLWSLGVEEQFYVVWPLSYGSCGYCGSVLPGLLVTVIAIAYFSFLLNLNATSNNVVAAFYSPRTRFWELLSGSLLAWLSLYRPNTRFELYRLTKLRIFSASHPRAEQIGKIAVNLTSIIGSLSDISRTDLRSRILQLSGRMGCLSCPWSRASYLCGTASLV